MGTKICPFLGWYYGGSFNIGPEPSKENGEFVRNPAVRREELVDPPDAPSPGG